MRELWAVIGRMCIDKDFHRDLHDAAEYRTPLVDLNALRQLLRRDLRLNISRWEVMKINEIVTEELPMPNDDKKVQIPSVDADARTRAIREKWSWSLPEFHPHLDMYAVIGLSAMDGYFRRAITDADVNTELRELLNTPSGETPIFTILPEDIELLYNFYSASGTSAALEDFHSTRWVQPSKNACDGGFTPSQFWYISQSNLMLSLQKNPELEELLRSFGVII